MASAASGDSLDTNPPDGTPDQPVGSGDRLVSLDFIRGIAVLGILFANIVAFGHVLMAYSWPGALPQPMSQADEAVWLTQYVLIDGKMRGLFSLLFGSGMALFVDRAWERGAGRGLQARRLFILMIVGLVHFYFIWWGDILFLYSVSGFVGLMFLKWKAGTLIRVGLFWYLLGSLVSAASSGIGAQVERSPPMCEAAPELCLAFYSQFESAEEDAVLERAAYTQGSYLAELDFTFTERATLPLLFLFSGILEIIPLMLIGMGLYRAGLFSGALDPRKQRLWGWAGLASGSTIMLALGTWAMREDYPYFLTQFVFQGGAQAPRLLMILGLAALLALWAPKAARGWLGSRLAAAGRMAFSNYLGTSIVMMFVFRSWAGGQFDQLGRLELAGVVLAAWVLMLAWSKPWLARFRYGPLEWLWRCLTYGRLFPLKR